MNRHACHALRCDVTIPEIALMCVKHWWMVPAPLRTTVMRAYRPNQENDKQPSDAYIHAAMAAVHSVADQEKIQPTIQVLPTADDAAIEFWNDLAHMSDLVQAMIDHADHYGTLLPEPIPAESPLLAAALDEPWPPDHAAQLLKAWRTTNNATQGASA